MRFPEAGKKEVGTRPGITPRRVAERLGAPGTRWGRYSSTLRKTGMTPRAPGPLPSWLPLRISAADNQVRHLPLSTALKLHEGNYTALLAVLQPLKEAARESSC
ncbi:MAG: hypothetical protein ACLT8E_10075 [Akkermansia sp.]